MSAIEKFVERVNHRLFKTITGQKLVYNSCWEDPAIDRELLKLEASSRVLMLTSAGDNALAYLLDNPACIDCVDINPAQNALLKWKRALFNEGDYASLWQMFGLGYSDQTTTLYHRSLRDTMSSQAQIFWDHHLDYFSPAFTADSFYYRGTAGAFARLACKQLKFKGLYSSVINLINARSLKEQRYYFEEVEPQIWSSFFSWLMQQEATLALLGVPKTQRAIIDNDVPGGLTGFVRRALRHVFTQTPVADNYFWRVYLTGSYTHACCPAYLKETNFPQLQKRTDRLSIHTASLLQHLRRNPGAYSHFILLDHQDWIAHHNTNQLAEEWRLILQNAKPGSRILFRSAGATRSFVPDFVDRHVHFRDEQTDQLSTKDRVGTYGSTHLAIVDQPL